MLKYIDSLSMIFENVNEKNIRLVSRLYSYLDVFRAHVRE